MSRIELVDVAEGIDAVDGMTAAWGDTPLS